jgi:DNA-binding MarR family transcriptional regulator
MVGTGACPSRASVIPQVGAKGQLSGCAPRPSKTAAGRPRARPRTSKWGELADLILVIAREIQFRGYADPRVQRLTQSEGMVMRHLQDDSDAAPSRIAAATGLQRTNLSTVLRAVEKKCLIKRQTRPDDARGVRVHLTEHGKMNYSIVLREWGSAVSTAAGGDTSNLDAALALLTTIKTGLTTKRPDPTER